MFWALKNYAPVFYYSSPEYQGPAAKKGKVMAGLKEWLKEAAEDVADADEDGSKCGREGRGAKAERERRADLLNAGALARCCAAALPCCRAAALARRHAGAPARWLARVMVR